MWFRVEVAKDGSIASCTEVEACVIEGKHVRYVEADSRADAIKLIQAWWARMAYNKARREKWKDHGKCHLCGDTRRPGLSTCQPCRDRQRQRRAERRAGAPLLHRSKATTDAERLAVMIRNREQRRLRRKEVGGHRAQILRAILVRFDSTTPRAFRAWLVSEIERLQSKAVK